MDWTNAALLRHRTVVLANGGTLPIAAAIDWLGKLTVAQDADDLEWDPIYHLRELALGRPLDPEQKRTFVHDGLLRTDGTLDPEFRNVILSAVHGQGRMLHLQSPFTDSLDRSLAEFVLNREVIIAASDLGQLDRDLIQALLVPSRFETALDRLRDSGKPGSGDAEQPPQSTDTPSQDAKSFAKRVLRKPLPPDAPPPPPK